MNEKATSEYITEGVNWFRNVPQDYADIDTLLHKQRRFAARIYDFSLEVGMLYKQRNRTEFQRKAEFARLRKGYIAPLGSVAKAESEALVEVEGLLDIEQQADGEYVAAKLLLDHARDVLQSMVQHISNLKAEKRSEMSGTGSQGV